MAKNMIKLVAPEGASSVSFEGETYEVKKGLVEVPAQAVGDVCAAHGYTSCASNKGSTAAASAPPHATLQDAPAAPAASVVDAPWLKG